MYKNICWTIRQATGRDWTWRRVAAYRRTLCTTLVRQVEAESTSKSDEAATQEALLRQFAQMPVERIRNFSIIAHVDHGKSTLADRLLELTGAISREAGQNQVLDNLQVERERGITVKAQTASIFHKYQNELYLLNLIDTPGHVDFSNEVTKQERERVPQQTEANPFRSFFCRSHARWRLAMVSFCLWTPVMVSRRRLWPIIIWPSNGSWLWCRCSTRSTSSTPSPIR